jgi:uncharacterized membrane protein YeaQ/YmgE (transglycosylase-associated protein family)
MAIVRLRTDSRAGGLFGAKRVTARTAGTQCDHTAIGCHPSTRESSTQQPEPIVSLLTWIVLGLVAGFVASKIVNKSGEGFVLDVVLGIAGAVIGGWLFSTFGMAGVSGLNLYSFVVAIVGAVAVLIAYHVLVRGSR